MHSKHLRHSISSVKSLFGLKKRREMSKIAIITGSTRTPRVGSNVAKWVSEVLKGRPTDNIQIEHLEISDFNLPVFDEEVIPMNVPARAQYTKEHTKKWSNAISPYAGFIFLTSEYNGSIPAGLKNAIDYLFSEWVGKPAIIVSYGGGGGKSAAGHLNDILGRVKITVSSTKTNLTFTSMDDKITAATKGVIQDSLKKEWIELGQDKSVLQGWAELKEALESKANGAN